MFSARNTVFSASKFLDMFFSYYGNFTSHWERLNGDPESQHELVKLIVERAYIEEPLFFAQSCGPLSAFVGAYYTDPSAAELPENWCVEGDGGYPLDEADLSYSTSSVSYTAADLGYPVGNLNYFPEKKSAWEGEPNTAVGLDNFTNMIKVYPNPAKDIIYLQFSNNYNKRSESAIKILNTLGEVKFESNFREQIFEIDLSTIGQAGLYFIQIFDHTNRIVDVRKIILE